jgi:hypothetical protein
MSYNNNNKKNTKKSVGHKGKAKALMRQEIKSYMSQNVELKFSPVNLTPTSMTTSFAFVDMVAAITQEMQSINAVVILFMLKSCSLTST